jgi:hypothetical protein
VLRFVVDAVEHDVLERHATRILLLDVVPARVEQVLDRMLAVDRYDLAAQRVVRRMQRDGQRDVGFVRDAEHLRHEARRTHRHAATRQVEAEVIHHDLRGRHDVAVIRERLAHAHEHDVGDHAVAVGRIAELAVGKPHLPDDFGGVEVAVETLLRRRAEAAVHLAADLARDAQRAATRLRDEHHLDRLAALEPEQPLARAVRRHLRQVNVGRADFGDLGETTAEVLAEIRHRVEVTRGAPVHPLEQLAGAERLLAHGDDERLQPCPGEPEQVGACRRCRCFAHVSVDHAPRREFARAQRGQSSVSEKKNAISRAAFSALSEPCTTFCSMLSARSARIVPGVAFFGSVAP